MLYTSLLSAALLLTSAFAAEDGLRRNLKQADGHLEYEVGRRAPTLYMVSRDLYGTEAKWKQLAEWNALVEPYKLAPGQVLSVREAPTVDEEAADEIVAKAWAHLGNDELAGQLRVKRAPAEVASAAAPVPADVPAAVPVSVPEPAPTDAPVVTLLPAPASAPAPAVTATTAPSPVTTESAATDPATPAEAAAAPSAEATAPAPEAPPVTVPVVTTPAPSPAPCACAAKPATPLAVAALTPEEDESDVPPWPWQWRADLIGSLFHLTNKTDAFDTDLYSRLNYGLEVEALYRVDASWGIGAVASTEHITMEDAKNGVRLRQSARDFVRLGLVARLRPMDALALHAGVTASQRPLALASPRGLTLYSVVLPEVTVGADVPVIDVGWSAALTFEALWSAPVGDRHFDVRAGYGGQVGFRVEAPIGNGAHVTLAPRYRYLKEDTRDARNAQSAAVVNLGVTW